jgi:hypothetical protein
MEPHPHGANQYKVTVALDTKKKPFSSVMALGRMVLTIRLP